MSDKLYVVSVFLPREHVKTIRDWVIYHNEMGFSVVLYDNTGSVKSERPTSGFYSGELNKNHLDKRGHCYKDNFEGSDEECSEYVKYLLADLDVEIVKWQPKNELGEIIHGQIDAYVDFIRGHLDSWAAFIDCDEFLFAAKGSSFKDLMKEINDRGCYRVYLEGIKETMEGDVVCKQKFGQKNLLRCDKIIKMEIHSYVLMADGNRICIPDNHQFHFKHRHHIPYSLTYEIRPGNLHNKGHRNHSVYVFPP